MSRRSAVELLTAVIAVGAIAFLVTRDDDSGEKRASNRDAAREDSRGPSGSTDQAGQGEGEVSAEPTKAELEASRRVQDRVSLNTTAAENTLAVFGLEGRVEIRDEGRVAIVFVTQSSACKALPADEARIKRFLLDAQPTLREVEVRVEGTGQSLSEYVKANCHAQPLPGGPGKTVYKQKGDGFVTGKTFKVKKRKWAVDWRAEGGRLLMLVFKKKPGEDKVLVPGIAQKKRGVGSQKYKEGRGRYYIEIRGLGHWTVRVRDGA